MCLLRNLLDVLKRVWYNKVKSSTVTAGYGVTNMIKDHRVMMKALRGQFNQWN